MIETIQSILPLHIFLALKTNLKTLILDMNIRCIMYIIGNQDLGIALQVTILV